MKLRNGANGLGGLASREICTGPEVEGIGSALKNVSRSCAAATRA